MPAIARFSAAQMQRLKELHATFCNRTATPWDLGQWTSANILVFQEIFSSVDLTGDAEPFLAWLEHLNTADLPPRTLH
jgi:hypothetical protein